MNFRELPTLPELMDRGFGLSDALAEWNKLANGHVTAVSHAPVGDPTKDAIRRAIDARAAAWTRAEPFPAKDLIDDIVRRFLRDNVDCVFSPADVAAAPELALTLKPAFRAYLTFAAEYLVEVLHGLPPVSTLTDSTAPSRKGVSRQDLAE